MCVCVCVCACLVAQLCLTLCNPVDYSPPGFSVHGILQVRILEWIAISFSRGSSWLREWTLVCRFFITEPPPVSSNGTILHTQVPIQKWGHPWSLLPLIYSLILYVQSVLSCPFCWTHVPWIYPPLVISLHCIEASHMQWSDLYPPFPDSSPQYLLLLIGGTIISLKYRSDCDTF